METKTTVPAVDPHPSVTRFAPGSSGARACQLVIVGIPVQVQPRTAEDNDGAVRLANYLTSVTPPDPAGIEMSDVDRERMMNLELRDALAAHRKTTDVLLGRLEGALAAITEWARYPGEEHRLFALDQAVRALTGCTPDDDHVARVETVAYREFVLAFAASEDGPEAEWSTGAAP